MIRELEKEYNKATFELTKATKHFEMERQIFLEKIEEQKKVIAKEQEKLDGFKKFCDHLVEVGRPPDEEKYKARISQMNQTISKEKSKLVDITADAEESLKPRVKELEVLDKQLKQARMMFEGAKEAVEVF